MNLLGVLNHNYSDTDQISSYLDAFSAEHYEKEDISAEQLETHELAHDAIIIFSGKGGKNSREVYLLIIQLRQLTDAIIMVFQEQKEAIDKVMNLQLGADINTDPSFTIKEVHLLLENLVKRKKKVDQLRESIRKEMEQVSKVTPPFISESFNDGSMSVRLANRDIYFTSKEYMLIRLLQENCNQVCTYQEIYEFVWNRPYENQKIYITNVVFRIREKFRHNGLNLEKYIYNIRGVGYRFHCEERSSEN
ncbi:winged helix-turn-helix domain-containing protein [Enterococcus sp. AZ196]|uniref:winged helix-turn-helix domain-containing protein n=1 Tax=Enterococcus sp. AZ196 TaxID=2774659 RepID=UPI003D27EC7C